MTAISNERTFVWLTSRKGQQVFFSVGIFRILRRKDPDEMDRVIFECRLPGAIDFIENIDFDSIVDVRHVDYGPADNPVYGRTICYIRNLMYTEQWVNKMALIQSDGPMKINREKSLRVHLHAKCIADFTWDWMKEPENI